MYSCKKKDFFTPFGDVVEGRELEFDLISPSLEEVCKAYEEGFEHLGDGTFIWAKKPDGKVIHLYKDGFEFIKDSKGNFVDFEHIGSGTFKQIIITEEN